MVIPRNSTVIMFLILLTFFESCKIPETRFRIVSVDTSTKAEAISYLQLAKNYKYYQGKYVDIKGLFGQSFEHFGICPDSAEWTKDLNCFWLGIDKNLKINESDLRRMNMKIVRIKGLFDSSNKGHLNSYYGTIRNIYFWELQ